MRTKNSILNIIANVGTLLIQTLLVFIVRIVFARTLNAEYLGIQGLLTNIISMLSLAELGIGTAISFSLYEPLAQNDTKKVCIVVTLLKKIYFSIGIIIIALGIILLPCLKYLTTSYTMGNLNIIFIIYLLTLAFEYFISYPEILITADQKNYKIAHLNLIYLILLNALQIMILIISKNFILYILSDLILKTLKFIISNIYIRKQYPNIIFNCKDKLDSKEKQNLIKNIKSLFIYKIGNYLVNGTDNIIISKFINMTTTGIYSNYLSIIFIFKNVMHNVMTAVTSSFGNLIVKENKEIQENVFDVMNFITFVFTNYIFLCLIFLFNPFIEICFGPDYLLENHNVLIICINFYLMTILLPVEMVKNAAGIYYEDRYVTIIQAIVNLILSIFLSINYGLIGVLIGTTISYLFVTVWERPFIVYKNLFNSNSKKYFIDYLKNILFVVFLIVPLYLIIERINLSITIIGIILIGIIITIVYLISVLVFFHNKKEFKYLVRIIRNKVGAVKCQN